MEDLWTVFLGDQEWGWAFSPVPFCTLWLLLIVKISDHEHPSTRAAYGDRPPGLRVGTPGSPGGGVGGKRCRSRRKLSAALRSWAGSAADGAGGVGEQMD